MGARLVGFLGITGCLNPANMPMNVLATKQNAHAVNRYKNWIKAKFIEACEWYNE